MADRTGHNEVPWDLPPDVAQRLVAAASRSRRRMIAAPAHLRDHRDSGPAASTFAEPQRYDESGFPIPQRRASFAERVRRLLVG